MGTHPIFESDFDCLTVNPLLPRMFLLASTLLIAALPLVGKPILDLLKQKSSTDDEILIIERELKGISEQDDFVVWARLTRKLQELQKQQVKERQEHEQFSTKSISKTQSVLRLGLFVLFRSTPVVSLDENLVPVWLLKMASFSGLSFIRFGDVSCFIWYFCCKSLSNILGSFIPTVSQKKTDGIPDVLSNLISPKLD